MGRVGESLNRLDNRVLRYERLTPAEGSPVEGVWATMSPEQRQEAQRAAYNGLAVEDPRQAFVCAELMQPQVRRVRDRRVLLAVMLGVSLLVWVSVLVTGTGPPVSALVTMAVSVVFLRLLMDWKFERVYRSNIEIARSRFEDTPRVLSQDP